MSRYITELCPGMEPLILPRDITGEKKKNVNLVALGDVGATLLTGLCLLGADVIDNIGIFDMNKDVIRRYEMEMGQVGWPFGSRTVPAVNGIEEADLFDCDMLVFCASKAVPPIGASGDVRMAQFQANRGIIAHYGRLAKAANFKGIFAVVSDPVDPLCKEFLLTSGLYPAQVRGYGLGVMNKRAEYFARKDPDFSMYLSEGRAYGPHGQDLVIADSVVNYDDSLSRRLTDLTVKANLEVRELGFKPYIAPALSSGAISLLLTLTGDWNYSSVYLGKGPEGAFLGIKNRIKKGAVEIENLPLPEKLYARVLKAYRNLCLIN